LRITIAGIGQVVGGFATLRPAGDIARQLVADCEARLRELAGLVTTPARP
jgi:hypothetical protein